MTLAGRRWLDRAVALWLLVLVLFFAFRVPAWGKYDPLPTGIVPGAWYLLLAVLLLLLLHRAAQAGRLARRVVRTAVVVLTLLFTAMAWSRISLVRQVNAVVNTWPPRPQLLGHVVLDSLTSAQRAAWVARVGGHVALDGGRLALPLRIPPEWPLPNDVEIAFREISAQEVEVWGRAPDGVARCQSIVLEANVSIDTVARQRRCRNARTAPPDLHFARPDRRSSATRLPPETPRRPAWLQYRADAARTGRPDGTSSDSARTDGWRVTLDGPIRASASVAGDIVLIGGHGTGSLTALDRATGAVRWIARAPNWIHQGPVTDGRTVVAGFGDNDESFAGWAPSGVAAFDLASGTRRWSAFDEGSVMTSPVIHDGVIVYGTGAGEVRQRSLASGRLLAAGRLPGFATMAPPVAIGDTIIFSLDHGTACALLVTSLRRLWCHTMPELRMLGHAAPTIATGTVLVSGVGTIRAVSVSRFVGLPRALQWRLVKSALFPEKYEVYAGQLFVGLDLHDGHEVWRSPLFANPRLVDGHTSGTATIDGADAAIVLPVADTVVAFTPATGEVRWTAGAHAARGPPLIIAGRVVVAGRDGVITVRRLSDGALRCIVRRRIGWDRGGPVVAGNLLVFADLTGDIEAIPLADLLACRGSGAESPTP